MIDPQLIDILVCPETHQAVKLAGEPLVARVNAAIEAGTAVTRGGTPVAEAIQGGLVREDGRFLYPIRDEIPIMLIDEAIELDETMD